MKGFATLLFILYLILGFYLVNSGLSLISLPGAFASIDKWVVLLAGIFLLLGAFNHYRLKRYSY